MPGVLWVFALVMALEARCGVRERRIQGWRRTLLVGMAVLLSVGGSVLLSGSSNIKAAGTQSPSPPPSPSPRRAVLDRFCVSCHNARLRTGRASVGYRRRRSSRKERGGLGKGVAISFERAKCRRRACRIPTTPPTIPWHTISKLHSIEPRKPDPIPGRPAAYRLNRFQYANAVRDLIALEIDAASLLPADDSGYGFDNIGDVLTVSPLLLEKYLSAAAKISRLAVGDPALEPDIH